MDERFRNLDRPRRYKESRHKYSRRKYDRRFDEADAPDDVSCCGRPRQKHRYYEKRHHHRHHKKHKSKQQNGSRSKKSLGSFQSKDSVSSVSQSLLNAPEKSKSGGDEKNLQEKSLQSKSQETKSPQDTAVPIEKITEKSSKQTAAPNSQPALPLSRESQKQENSENPRRPLNLGKSEVLQELCVTQCIRDGCEISRLSYTTCFPVGKKPDFIYLPKLRFVAKEKPDDGRRKALRKSTTEREAMIESSSASYDRSPIADFSTEQNYAMKEKINRFLKNLFECRSALRSARKNLSNLKSLVGGDTLNELRGYDMDAKAIISELSYLEKLIHKHFEN